MTHTKECTWCHKVKPLEDFNYHPTYADGKFPYCKQCDHSRLAVLDALKGRAAERVTGSRGLGGGSKWMALPLEVRRQEIARQRQIDSDNGIGIAPVIPIKVPSKTTLVPIRDKDEAIRDERQRLLEEREANPQIYLGADMAYVCKVKAEPLTLLTGGCDGAVQVNARLRGYNKPYLHRDGVELVYWLECPGAENIVRGIVSGFAEYVGAGGETFGMPNEDAMRDCLVTLLRLQPDEVAA